MNKVINKRSGKFQNDGFSEKIKEYFMLKRPDELFRQRKKIKPKIKYRQSSVYEVFNNFGNIPGNTTERYCRAM